MGKQHPKNQDQDVDWDAAITGAAVRAVTQSRMVSRRKRKAPDKAREVHLLEESVSRKKTKEPVILKGLVREMIEYNPDSIENPQQGQDERKFSPQELAFLALYLSGEFTIDSAMIKAGYAEFPKTTRYGMARKLVKRYASGTEDKAEIFRDIGLSEVEVAHNIKEMMLNGRSEQARINAMALAAKCLRLTDEPERTHQGVRINIYTGSPAPTQGSAPPERPGSGGQVTINTQVITTNKPLQITK